MEITYINDMINEAKRMTGNKELNYLLWYRGHSDEGWELLPSVQRGN